VFGTPLSELYTHGILWLFHLPPSEILNWFWIICFWTRYFKTKIWMLTWKTYLLCILIHGGHRIVQIYTWAGPLYSNFTPSVAQPMCRFAQLYVCHELFLNCNMETPRKPLNKYWCSVPHNFELILNYLFLNEIFQNKDMDVNMENIFIVYFPT
jgi:hypothetical protein